MLPSRRTIRINRALSALYWVCLALSVLGAAGFVTSYLPPWEYNGSRTTSRDCYFQSIIWARGTVLVHVSKFPHPTAAPSVSMAQSGFVWRRDIRTVSYPLFAAWEISSRSPAGFDFRLTFNLVTIGILATVLVFIVTWVRRRRKIAPGFEIGSPTEVH